LIEYSLVQKQEKYFVLKTQNNVDNIYILGYNVAQYKGFIMSINAVVRARIDAQIKDEAIVVLSTMGLTLSDAFRMLLVRVAREKALPFEPLVPNDQTIKAMKAARRGDMVTVNSVNNLLASLNAND